MILEIEYCPLILTTFFSAVLVNLDLFPSESTLENQFVNTTKELAGILFSSEVSPERPDGAGVVEMTFSQVG